MQVSERISYPSPPKKEEWRGKSIRERKLWSVNCFIASDDTRTLIKDVIERVQYIDAYSASFGMLVLGGSGTGKTRLVRFLTSLVNDQYGRTDPEKTVMPVVDIKVPEACTTHEINVAVLTALGAIGADSTKKPEVLRRTKKALLECEVRLVIIDDFQDVPLRRGERGIDRIGAHLRDLMDASRAVWIFFGTEESNLVRNSKNQLIKRIPYLHRIGYFDIYNNTNALRFSRVLRLMDHWLPLAEQSCFQNNEFRSRMFFATSGVFDRLVKLLDAAMEVAVNDDRESLTREDLEQGFAALYGSASSSINPFQLNFTPRMLNQKDEPFEVLGAEIPKSS